MNVEISIQERPDGDWKNDSIAKGLTLRTIGLVGRQGRCSLTMHGEERLFNIAELIQALYIVRDAG